MDYSVVLSPSARRDLRDIVRYIGASAALTDPGQHDRILRMSSTQLDESVARLRRLSEARAERVVSLIEDLSELEALETMADLAAAHAALAELEQPLPWEQVKARLDAQFHLSQPAS